MLMVGLLPSEDGWSLCRVACCFVLISFAHGQEGDDETELIYSLQRPNSQARTRTGKYLFFIVQLTTCRIGNFTRLIHTLAICMTVHRVVGKKNVVPCLRAFLAGNEEKKKRAWDQAVNTLSYY